MTNTATPTTCEYNNGRICGKDATVMIGSNGHGAASCNRHRVATANKLAATYGDAGMVFVELPRPMAMNSHRVEVVGAPDQAREFWGEAAATMYANGFEFAEVVRIADDTVVHQTFALFAQQSR